MSMHSTSKRVVVGGLAATAGLATVAAPLAADVAGATDAGGNPGTGATPQAIPAPGTYESCTAYFGLTKGFSDLVSYDVKTEGPVSPAPVIGTNVIPILTVQTSGGEVQCIPELAWTDEATWTSWVGFGAALFTYPGSGYYLIPSTYGAELDTPDGPVVPLSTSIRFETSIEGASVTWTPAGPPATETGWQPFAGISLTSTSNGVPQMVSAIEAAGGDADATALAVQIMVDGTCDDADPGAASLAAALGVIFDTEFPANCSVVESVWYLYRRELFGLMVDRSLVVVTLTAPTPTTTSGAVSGDSVVAPSFTG
jgi:hypothetical protein